MSKQKSKSLTYGEWWEEHKEFSIFECPKENRIADKAGIYTVNIPLNKNETVVQEVEVHEDLNWSVISEKVIRTAPNTD